MAGYGARGGYSIGFDGDALFKRLEGRLLTPLGKVIYGDGFDADVVPAIRAIATECKHSGDRLSSIAASALLYRFALLRKHEAFKHEREWRYVRRQEAGDELHFSEGTVGPMPYIEIPKYNSLSPNLPITRVIIGPPHRGSASVELVQNLLKTYRFDGVAVEASGIPARF